MNIIGMFQAGNIVIAIAFLQPSPYLEVEPVAVVEVLPQQLDGGLRAVHLLLRHVHVVHEDDALLAGRRAVQAAAPLVELGQHQLLRLVGRRLHRERDKGGQVVVLVQLVHQ